MPALRWRRVAEVRAKAMAAAAAMAIGTAVVAGGAPAAGGTAAVAGGVPAAGGTAAAAQAGGCGDVLDAAPTSPERTGRDPSSVATGDFDRDGRQDLAVGDRRGVSILLGRGKGDFAGPRRVSLPTENRRTVVAGRFDADDLDDLAVVDTAGPRLTVLYGDGRGGFPRSLAAPPALPPLPLGAEVADFDGDGAQDLLVGTGLGTAVGAPRPGRGELAVLLGDGKGGFAPAAGSPLRLGLEVRTAVGDFDGDGTPDVAVPARAGRDVAIRLGDGRGGFTRGPVVETGGPLGWAVAARFDRDRDIDLAILAGNTASVLLGDGRGGFREVRGSRAATPSPTQLTAGDFNRDGRQDVAVLGLYGGEVTVVLGDGTGDLHPLPGQVERAGRYVYPGAAALDDLDGDDRPDLAIANPRHAGGARLSVILGTGARPRPGAIFRPALTATRSAHRITFGARVRLTATLRCGGRPLALQPLALERRGVHGGRLGPWRPARLAGTGVNGVARRRPRPQVNGQFRWRSEAGPGLRAVTSKALEVRVAPRITVDVGGTPPGGGTFPVRGRVLPEHPGHPVYLQRRTSGGWRSVNRAEVTESGSFAFAEPVDRPGPAEHRVLLPSHPDHATGRSATFLLRVRPSP